MGMEEVSEAESKTGKDLFLELVRLLPSSQVEDYYRNRQWLDEDMLLDWRLLEAHRREAGADEPLTLEELKKDGLYPELPNDKPGAAWIPLSQRPLAATMAAKPVGSVGIVGAPKAAMKPLAVVKSSTGPISGLRPTQPKSAPPAGVAAASAAGPSAELRQIALFIAKWKLEATKTKLILARLTPPRRRWVMTNFKLVGSAPPTTQLEQFIAQAERSNSWAATDSSTGSVAGAPKALSGLKRPLSAATTSVAVDPSKRARITPGTTPGLKPAVAKPYGVASAVGRPGLSAVSAYTRSSGLAGGSVARIGVGKPFAAKAPIRSVYGAASGGISGLKPGVPKATGSVARPGLKPALGSYGVAKPGVAKAGLIKPAVGLYKPVGKPGPPKAGPAKAKGAAPGSLIANLLKM